MNTLFILLVRRLLAGTVSAIADSSFVIIAFFNDIPINFMSFYRNSSWRLLTCLMALVSLSFCLSCGNNNYNGYGYASPSSTSGYKHRILVSNSYVGSLLIINAVNNFLYGRPITVSPQPQYLALSHDGKFTLSYSNSADTLYYFDNSQEQVTGNNISLSGDVESLGILSNNTTAITASRNAPVNGGANGVIYFLDLTNRVISQAIAVPLVRRVVLDSGGNTVLAFADNTNYVYLVNTTANTATAIPDPNGVLDRPVNAVFSSDGSTAYILSCGAECGGTQAKVTTYNVGSNSFGNSVDVSGATAGVLDSSGNLWVAGSPNGVGYLQSISTSSLTPSAPVAITNGYHNLLTVSDDNRLYVGAKTCSNIADQIGNPIQGCLSIYNMSSGNVVKAAMTGDVTGLQADIGQHQVFATQGGYLVIYNTTNDQPLPQSQQIAISGQAYAVLQIS